ncbi:MAG: hypothetical protein ABF617_05680 [Gluconobacter japonicus]|uniref:hypothetical protein n=1 Tax=Gluconobacter japonicus TaxID=376620 RepID=UPI0039EA4D99
MSGSVIMRTGHEVVDGKIIHNDQAMSWEEADKRAGFRLDRRKSWAFIPNKHDLGIPELCEMISFTRACSGCEDSESMYPSAVGAGCHECGYTGKSRETCFVPFCRPERIRKAWRATFADDFHGIGELISAPTASKARYQKFLSADCDAVTFASIRVTRSPDDDIILPAVDAITAALDEEAKSVLNHTLINKRFYTATDDKAICSLVQAGLLENTGRGWNTGESYFVLTDAGHTAAVSLRPIYPAYPEYRA